jgi:hypothetical protein
MAPVPEIGFVFAIEPVVIVFIIDTVAIMPMPGRIRIVSIAGIGILVDAHVYAGLGAGAIKSQRYSDNSR